MKSEINHSTYKTKAVTKPFPVAFCPALASALFWEAGELASLSFPIFLLTGLRVEALGREGREGLATGGPGVDSSMAWTHAHTSLGVDKLIVSYIINRYEISKSKRRIRRIRQEHYLKRS